MDSVNRSRSRTWLCTVVFVDIVKYTNHPVSRQLALKERLNAFISQAIDHVAPGERVILDTGDGAALCFMGDPEDGFFAAIDIRNAFQTESRVDPAANLRAGIHLGPVKIVKDLNQHHNIIGEAINVAQRIMSFSAPNQLLASRSFYEVISPLSQEHANLFQFLGTRTDKHVREHAVYEVLLGEEDAAPSTPASVNSTDTDTRADSVALESSREFTIDPEVAISFERELAFYVGPLARILVKRASDRASGLTELRDMLAEHIKHASGREAFLQKTALLCEESPANEPVRERPSTFARVNSGAYSPIPPQALRQAETLLAQQIGPVARILVRREQRQAANLDELYARLAAHISLREARTAFLEARKSKL